MSHEAAVLVIVGSLTLIVVLIIIGTLYGYLRKANQRIQKLETANRSLHKRFDHHTGGKG